MTTTAGNYSRENPLIISQVTKLRIEEEQPDLIEELHALCSEGVIIVVPNSSQTCHILRTAEKPLVISPHVLEEMKKERPDLVERLHTHRLEGIVVVRPDSQD